MSKSVLKTLLFSLLFVSFHLPYLLNWDRSVVQIGDNLDSMLPTIYRLANSDSFFHFGQSDLTEGYNGQLYRNVLFSPWNITALIFWIFKTPWLAYIINLMVINLISMLGLFLLIKKLFGNRYFVINVLISFSFLALPRYTLFGGAVYSALPIVLYLFLELLESPTRKKAALFFLLPCLTGLVIGGFPVFIFISGLFTLFLIAKQTKLSKIWVVLLYGLGMVFAELNLFLFKLTNPFEPHRVIRVSNDTTEAIEPLKMLNFNELIIDFFEYLWRDGFNEQTSHPKPILVFLLFAAVVVLFHKKLIGTLNISLLLKNEKILVVFYSLASIFLIIISFLLLRSPLNKLLPTIFEQFDLSRISSLLPSLFYISFAACIFLIIRIKKFGVYIAFLLITINLVHGLRRNDGWKENIRVLLKQTYKEYDKASLVSFKRYYAQDFYAYLDREFPEIRRENIKVMHYGLHPAVSILSGLNTIDFYLTLYPLKYNKRVLSYLSDLKDNRFSYELAYWGNRAYLIDNYLFDNWKYKDQVIKSNLKTSEPKFNWTEIKKDDVRYVISAIELNNLSALALQRVYQSDKNVYHTLYLYKVL